jgi:hypothetical protein
MRTRALDQPRVRRRLPQIDTFADDRRLNQRLG